MPKTPTQWTPETNQPSGFTPYGSSNPTVLTNNDNGAPTLWGGADTKNPVSYSPTAKNPTAYASTFGLVDLTYDTLGSTYDDPSVTYDQAQANVSSPAPLATSWSAT